jgi:hypothetical protein
MVHVSGPSGDVIERRVATAARSYFADVRVSDKIRTMFLETPPDRIYVLSPADMAESDIIFVRAQ